MIRILLVDDHTIVRRGLKDILAEDPEFSVVGEAGTYEEMTELLGKKKIDVIMLDLALPDKNGLDIIEEIVSKKGMPPILVLSVYSEDHYGVRVLKAGASGFMNKEVAPTELQVAVRKVASGGKYVSSALAEKIAGRLYADADMAIHDLLSNREFQVMKMIASGKTLTEIGHELGLSVKTISTYRMRIMEKTRMHTNSELTHYAFQHKLVE
ncbi:MAG TPA: response regulator transcription factor [Bacteroidota bacterium]|nr:response regulator transcription factor [Bacteroidota bacterium]